MEEIWVDVVGFEGWYQVSNLGQIRRTSESGGARVGRILKARTDKRGYKIIDLNRKGKARTFKVHRLVAQAFIPNPENKREVNHLNGNRTYNWKCNLEWSTSAENKQHAINVLGSSNRGERHGMVKLTIEKVLIIRTLFEKTKLTHQEIGDIVGAGRANSGLIKLRKTWSWL